MNKSRSLSHQGYGNDSVKWIGLVFMWAIEWKFFSTKIFMENPKWTSENQVSSSDLMRRFDFYSEFTPIKKRTKTNHRKSQEKKQCWTEGQEKLLELFVMVCVWDFMTHVCKIVYHPIAPKVPHSLAALQPMEEISFSININSRQDSSNNLFRNGIHLIFDASSFHISQPSSQRTCNLTSRGKRHRILRLLLLLLLVLLLLLLYNTCMCTTHPPFMWRV